MSLYMARKPRRRSQQQITTRSRHSISAPNHKFYHNNNSNLKMSHKPQSFSRHDNRCHLVPQLMQPRQPTQQFPSATPSPAVWKPRTPPPQPNTPTSFDKKKKKVSSKLSNARYHIPTVSQVPEDRSHLKPQPMLPRTPAPTTVSSPSPNAQLETKVMPPSPNSIEDTMPTKPESLLRKSKESREAIQLDKSAESVPWPSSPTAGLFRKESSFINNNPPQRQPIQPNQLPAATEAQYLQKSMANLKLSTRPMESKSAQRPVKQNYRWYLPEIPQTTADSSKWPPDVVKTEPKVVSPAVHRVAPTMLCSASSVHSAAVSTTPDPINLPATSDRAASPTTSPEASFGSFLPTRSSRRRRKPR